MSLAERIQLPRARHVVREIGPQVDRMPPAASSYLCSLTSMNDPWAAANEALHCKDAHEASWLTPRIYGHPPLVGETALHRPAPHLNKVGGPGDLSPTLPSHVCYARSCFPSPSCSPALPVFVVVVVASLSLSPSLFVAQPASLPAHAVVCAISRGVPGP